MKLEIQTVLSQNITLVYDSLPLQAIDRNKLRELVDSQVQPVVMDTPEMIVLVYPPEPIVIRVGDRRIRITLQQQSEGIGHVPLWEIAHKCDRLVSGSKSALVAYGFNYDVGVALADGNAHTVTKDLFVADPHKIESALAGHILSFTPRVTFERDQIRYDLVFEAVDEQHLKVHLNTHFEFNEIALPSQDALQAAFREGFEYLISMLPRLFEGDE